MRWTDEAEIASVTPARTSARASSAQLHVDSERPQSSGNSQASFTRCAATIGGKTRGAPATKCIIEPEQTKPFETVRPLADQSARHPHPACDLRHEPP